MLDQRRLIDIAATLVDTDAGGRLVGRGPRRLYVLRTSRDVRCLVHRDLSADVAATLEAIARRPRGPPRDWAHEYAAYLSVLAQVAPISAVRAGPVYCALDDPTGVAAVAVDADNAGRLQGELAAWRGDVARLQPMYAVVEDGRAVSLCASVAASDRAHAAGVETARDHRGRGLAVQAVAAWARAVRALGAIPFYGTSFDNIASQGVARRLGLTLVGAEFWIECEGG
jgi:GNAT superfamily N-acetyltransferase